MPTKETMKTSFPGDKKTLLIYSLYLAVGSVSLFICFNVFYTVYQGYIWSYSTQYIQNSLATALIMLISALLLLIGCYWLAKGKTVASSLAATGCLILIIYPVYVWALNAYVPYAYHYILLLWLPALVVLLIVVYIWNKQRMKK